jgi:hypothetical protein
MTDVKSLSDARTGQRLVQVPLYTTQADANLNFTGIGRLSVDGAPETLRANNYKGTLSVIIDGVAILSLLIGVLGLWYAARNDTRGDQGVR